MPDPNQKSPRHADLAQLKAGQASGRVIEIPEYVDFNNFDHIAQYMDEQRKIHGSATRFKLPDNTYIEIDVTKHPDLHGLIAHSGSFALKNDSDKQVKINLAGADLQGTSINFEGSAAVDLTGANFSGGQMDLLSSSDNNKRDINFTGGDVSGAKFLARDATINLNGANIEGVRLENNVGNDTGNGKVVPDSFANVSMQNTRGVPIFPYDAASQWAYNDPQPGTVVLDQLKARGLSDAQLVIAKERIIKRTEGIIHQHEVEMARDKQNIKTYENRSLGERLWDGVVEVGHTSKQINSVKDEAKKEQEIIDRDRQDLKKLGAPPEAPEPTPVKPVAPAARAAGAGGATKPSAIPAPR